MKTDVRRAIAHPDRYWRILRFFGGVLLSVAFWEVLLRVLLGRRAVARNREERLHRYARDFRMMAVRMGGVMIKLGQFLSARVDVLPREIIDELAGLQDEVPPAPLDGILAIIREDLGPLEGRFAHFETDEQAAASLGQVYRARLPNGDRVVVKVQRPGIEDLVATDLAALAVVARWAMFWPLVRRRADVPALLEEFARTLWEELNYIAEAANAERLRELFADDPTVYIPAVYHDYTTKRVLTLEDVTAVKIADHDAVDAAGVSRKLVAQRLLDVYLRMIFDFGFFHADPHPGNLFIYPFSQDDLAKMALPERVFEDGGAFRIVFVDFGMTGTITAEVRTGLREALIAVGTRDMKRLVQAYQKLGVLLPSADIERIQEAEQAMLDRVWGKSMTEIASMAHTEMYEVVAEFRDLLFEMPFQVPQNFIYLVRAVGILSGMCTALDPAFNPWQALLPYVRGLVEEEMRDDSAFWVQEAALWLQRMIMLPALAESVLTRAGRGELEMRFTPSESFQQDINRLERSLNRVALGAVSAALILAGTQLYLAGEHTLGVAGYAGAATALLALVLMRAGR